MKEDLVIETPIAKDHSVRNGQAATRIELHKMMIAKKTIEECPWMLAERVASHYLKLAKAAQSLYKMQEQTCYNDFRETNNMRECETYLLDMIAREHCHDFGDEPSWWKALWNLKRFHADMPVREVP